MEDRDREREREKASILKEDIDSNAASKRRKLKRDHMPSEPGEYSPAAPPPPPLSINLSQPFDGRDRGDRKGAMVQRPAYLEEPGLRLHGKEAAGKAARRDTDLYPQFYFYMQFFRSYQVICSFQIHSLSALAKAILLLLSVII